MHRLNLTNRPRSQAKDKADADLRNSEKRTAMHLQNRFARLTQEEKRGRFNAAPEAFFSIRRATCYPNTGKTDQVAKALWRSVRATSPSRAYDLGFRGLQSSLGTSAEAVRNYLIQKTTCDHIQSLTGQRKPYRRQCFR